MIMDIVNFEEIGDCVSLILSFIVPGLYCNFTKEYCSCYVMSYAVNTTFGGHSGSDIQEKITINLSSNK